MKSIVMKSIYAGLGLLGSGKETVEELGRKLAKKAELSEQEGEKIARHLHIRSRHAINAMEKALEAEVTKVVSSLRAASKTVAGSIKKKRPARRRPAKRKGHSSAAH